MAISMMLFFALFLLLNFLCINFITLRWIILWSWECIKYSIISPTIHEHPLRNQIDNSLYILLNKGSISCFYLLITEIVKNLVGVFQQVFWGLLRPCIISEMHIHKFTQKSKEEPHHYLDIIIFNTLYKLGGHIWKTSPLLSLLPSYFLTL